MTTSMFGETGPFCECVPVWISDGNPTPHQMQNFGTCQVHPIGPREPTIRENSHYERVAAAAPVPTMAVAPPGPPLTRGEAVERLREIAAGIDGTEDGGGWWETSTGAAFGAGKLVELEHLVRDLTEPSL